MPTTTHTPSACVYVCVCVRERVSKFESESAGIGYSEGATTTSPWHGHADMRTQAADMWKVKVNSEP